MSRSPKDATGRPGYAARAAATRLLTAVFDARTALDSSLESDAAFSRLDARDKALARAIVGTALRRHGTIDAVLSKLIEKRPRNAGGLTRILETAAAQILFMGVADHAAVSLAVDQIVDDHDGRHFKGFANAVLRRMARERDALVTVVDAPGIDTPPWLWARWRRTYGEEKASRIAEAHRIEPGLDLSVKSDPEAWAEKLGGIVIPTGTVRLVPSGPIDEMPGFADGEWWVQDAAAALPVAILGDVRGKRVADLCAAPGGKTAALAHAGALVTAVDISAKRLERVRQNLQRLHLTAEIVAADILEWTPLKTAPTGTQGYFDAILLDAPCTSTGTIRRHPDVAWLKRPEDVATLSAMQARMIDRAVALLKPEGTLVFCTCSLEPEEGEAHFARALRDLPLTPLPIVAAEIGNLAEAVTPEGTVRALPSHLSDAAPRLSGLDGFFIMRVKKG